MIYTEEELKRLQTSKRVFLQCRQGGGTDTGKVSIRKQVRGSRSPSLRADQGSELSNQVLKIGHFKSQFEVAQCNRQEKSHLSRLLGTEVEILGYDSFPDKFHGK